MTIRVLHVVNGVAPDDRFGGVTRVALELAAGASRGEAALIGGATGFDVLPKEFEGVPVVLRRGWRLSRRLGWGSFMSPGFFLATLGTVRHADVVHVHLGRDLHTIFAATVSAVFRKPLILQTHGMMDAPSNILAKLIDSLFMKRILAAASEALVLTQAECEVLLSMQPALLVTKFPNGIKTRSAPTVPMSDRSEIVFVGRLHPRKGATVFAAVAARLAADYPSFSFRVIGPDEGDLVHVKKVLSDLPDGHNIHLEPGMSHESAQRVLGGARIHVLPAPNEPFGMTLLEAMRDGTPVVVHASAELASIIEGHSAGEAFDGGEDGLEDVLRRLLDDNQRLASMSANASALVADRFSLEHTVSVLGERYVLACSTGRV